VAAFDQFGHLAVKVGKEEQYLKDAAALDGFLLRIALKDASISTGGDTPQLLDGPSLADLARKHQVAEAVIERLSNFMDAEALRAIADGVALNLDTLDDAAACAPALQAKLRELNTTGVPAEVTAEFDVRTDKPLLRISRRHHGNIKSSVITQDFVHGADYAALAEAAETFRGLLAEGAKAMRGEGEAVAGVIMALLASLGAGTTWGRDAAEVLAPSISTS
jgi:DNA gyrase subunit B